MNPVQQKLAAKEFVSRWLGRGDEKQDAQSFWRDLLVNVLGVPSGTLANFIAFERRVQGGFIDAFIEDTGVLVEQKGQDINPLKPQKQSDGALLSPYEQAARYAAKLPFSIRPRWIVVCNFKSFLIFDQETDPNGANPQELLLENLPQELYRLAFITDKTNSRIERERALSVKAGEIVGRLYGLLASQYRDIEEDPEEQRSLNVLIVRMVFCLYAEDARLFHERDAFLNYLKRYEAPQFRDAIINLFKALNTPKAQRDPYLDPELLRFPYVNGGLFADESIIVPQFTAQIRTDLLLEASQKFDWSGISPTIFGAAFESTLNPETRRSGGMHYTSIENIHKVIDPLFLDALKAELEEIEAADVEKKRLRLLRIFQDKLASLKVFDPACGSGNFLTESYLSLRKLENRVIEGLQGGQVGMALGEDVDPIKVSINQFYGIEINDFAVSVAKTALWIAEAQMMDDTQEIVYTHEFDFLPLKTNANIHEGNALRMDWNDVLPAEECSYICGNPPFLGARNQSTEQKADVMEVFDGAKNTGNIDYVAAWYMRAAKYIQNSPVRCAFVSTNSICQGEQAANIWKPIFDLGIHIDFAHKTFRWVNEASGMAHVFVVVVGFSQAESQKEKVLFEYATPDSGAEKKAVRNINAYLSDAPGVFVWNRTNPLRNVPKMGIGNKPIDGGNYLFKPDEKEAFIAAEPEAEKYFRKWMGSEEFIKGKERWVLWLGDATEEDLVELPLCRGRIETVRSFRLASKSAPTRKIAEKPRRFHVENMPEGTSILVPKVSSERRLYIPMGFIGPEIFCSDLVFLIPNANLHHFGVLQSQFHNAWMRVVCGRLESRYRYSAGVVYNNFPWPTPTDEQKAAIEQRAQSVLDAREAHPGKSLADLYDPDKMPEDLLAAHKALDAAVEAAYGVNFNGDEEKIVAHLFRLYAELTSKE